MDLIFFFVDKESRYRLEDFIGNIGLVMIYYAIYYVEYVVIFALLVFLGNVIAYSFRALYQKSIYYWSIFWGILFLLFPFLLKIILHDIYYEIGGYLAQYRDIKFYLTYFLFGSIYGLIYYRISKKYNL